MFKFRNATVDDAKIMTDIWAKGWIYAYKNILSQGMLERKTSDVALQEKSEKFVKKIENAKEDNVLYLVITDDDKVIGFVEGGVIESKECQADKELHTLYINTDYIGRGVGKMLFQEFAKRMKEQGAKTFGLMCFTDNKSMGFYKKMGGRITITRPSSEKWESKLGSFLEFDIDDVLSK